MNVSMGVLSKRIDVFFSGTDENQVPKTVFQVRKIPPDGDQISKAYQKRKHETEILFEFPAAKFHSVQLNASVSILFVLSSSTIFAMSYTLFMYYIYIKNI